MIFPLFSLNPLNVASGASLPLSPLLPTISTLYLSLILFQNFVSNTLTIKFIFPLITCFVWTDLLFFFFHFALENNGIPLWFRCFKSKHNPQAYKIDLIKEGISFCNDLFAGKNHHIIFLGDRLFPNIELLSHIESIGCYYCIRSKSFFTYSYYNKKR